ncbi:MAG: hypothetical protein AB8B71_16490 [Paracoccaceae bacterium]
MLNPDTDTIHATISVSPVRRGAAYAVQLGLGALLVYAGFAGFAGFVGATFLVVMGVLVLWGAERMRQATRMSLVLTDDGLFDTSGAQLAAMSEITGVSRGAFALKPSNGFALILNAKQPRAWVPGMWWRFGNRVGVGGVTNAGASKFMAEQIALRLAGAAL